MKNLNQILSFSIMEEDESEIYLLLHKVGPQTVGTISKILKKSRTNLYYHIEKMVEKGFILQQKYGHISRYCAVDINKLINDLSFKAKNEYQKQQLEISKLNEVKNEILNLAKFSYFQPKIDLFTGELSLKKMYEQALEDQYCYTYFTPWDNRPDLIEIDEWHTEQRVKKQQPVKMIMAQTKATQEFIKNKSKFREVKIIEKKSFPFKDIAMITNNKFLIFSETDNIAVSINNQFIAQNQSVIFEYLWNKS